MQDIKIVKTSEEELTEVEQKRNEETERERVRRENEEKQLMEEFYSYKLDVPTELLAKIPKSKHKNLIDGTKNEVIGREIHKARERIAELNGSGRERKEADLILAYRNTFRQLAWNKTRLNLLKEGKEVRDNDGHTVRGFDVGYLVDKLTQDLFFQEKEMKLFGLDPQQHLKEL